jgi:hypothetical protein
MQELFESAVIVDDPFGNNRVLFFGMTLFEIFQRRYVCFFKELF